MYVRTRMDGAISVNEVSVDVGVGPAIGRSTVVVTTLVPAVVSFIVALVSPDEEIAVIGAVVSDVGLGTIPVCTGVDGSSIQTKDMRRLGRAMQTIEGWTAARRRVDGRVTKGFRRVT